MRALVLAFLFMSNLSFAESTVIFQGVGSPGFLNIDGTGAVVRAKAHVKDNKYSGFFDVDLSEFRTGISLRDKHMRDEYLEVEKFPKATLVLYPVTLPAQGFFNWSGKLTLHGVSKPVDGEAFVDKTKIEAKFSVNMSDYNIKKAIYMKVGVDDKINIVVNLDYPI